jgi:hypothetical protein
MVENCDTNDDGSLSYCEIHACTVEIENIWRDENCDAGYGYAVCPYDCDEPCEGAWTCDWIIEYTILNMEVLDTNGDE